MLSLLMRFLIGANFGVLEGVLTFVMWNSMVVLGIELFLYHKSIMEKETLLARMECEKATYQYEALKSQMNPHFLFNSLNALASLAYQDAEKANLFAKKLSQAYRYLLATYERQLVTLDEELNFLCAYLYLEDIRFGQAVQVNIFVDNKERKRLIVPAALQTLVENALKHNVATEERPLKISVTACEGYITVENNLQERGEVPSNKVGLSNLRRQYEIHGRQIQVEKTHNRFTVTLPLI